MRPEITRAGVQAQLATVRAALAASIAGYSEEHLAHMPVTPEWTGLDILRHIEVWAELASRCLNDWLGSRDWILTFASEDIFNQEMVALRATWPMTEVLAAIYAAYDNYAVTLATCSEADLAEEAAAPWGEPLSRLWLIAAALGHDTLHIGQLDEQRTKTRFSDA